ncbi:DegT/DnrJ/EryC1/StrS family aminotransferase [Candidatus Bathyarchaeota archaeon]|jgi:dTDP-4-amino-4,6-dideoxygalactose transaminase|nr:DegT/DnrJ/EryC1/StrS family aminotransferase [Candidatus Bathyarchaeota archaeon]
MLSKFLGESDPDFYGGPKIKEIERSFATRFRVRNAVSTNSGTTALHVAVAAVGIGPGDEVIVSPCTMSASATSILMQNAIPVFADVQDDIFCLDPTSVRERITPHTRAIMVTHLFGHPADMNPILDIAREYNLRVIEDAAQAIGVTYNGRYVGALGDAGVLSLNFHKIIHAGEGGIVLTDDDIVAERARMVRNHGECVVEAMGWTNIANTMGSNYRMTEIHAAIGIEQLRKLQELLIHRNKLASYLTRRLRKFEDIVTTPIVYPNATHGFYVYALKFKQENIGVSRQVFARALQAEGVPFAEGYVRPLYLLPLYQQRIAYGNSGCPWTCGHYHGQVKYDRGICPVAERLHDRELLYSDICHHPLTTDDMDDVAGAFEKISQNVDELKRWESEHGNQ